MGTVPGMYHQASLNLTDVNVEARMDENGEMRILGIEATLEVRLVVYEEEKIIFAFIFPCHAFCCIRQCECKSR